MAFTNGDWYDHLVEQSKTDHIYDLIHGAPLHAWDPNHDLDFVVLRRDGLLKETGHVFRNEDTSEALNKRAYCFPTPDYVLIDDHRLTDYLEWARSMRIVEDAEGREFIELVFEKEKVKEPIVYDESTLTDAAYWDMAPDKDGAIYAAYERLKVPCEKEEAYRYAKLGEAWLDTKRVLITDNIEASLFETRRILFSYNVLAMVYVWNDQIDEAAIVDSYYLRYPHIWDDLEEQIHGYLGLLMAKEQGEYLGFLFADLPFRKRFLAHYEAYISLLVDDTCPLTYGLDVTSIINRVNNGYKAYL